MQLRPLRSAYGILTASCLTMAAWSCKTSASTSTPTGPSALNSDSIGAVAAAAKCARPRDADGPLFFELTAQFAGISTDPGGGALIGLTRSPDGPVEQVRGTDELVERLRSMNIGTRITLVAYRVSSRSGAQPPFSCVELA